MNRRSNFFVYKKFQLVMIFYSFFLTVAVFSVFYLTESLYFYEAKSFIKLIDPESQEKFYVLFEHIEKQRDNILMLLFATLVFISGAYMLFLSNKISGPIVRTIEWLKTAKKNDQIAYRKQDYFHELSQEINTLSKRNNN